MDGLSVIVGKCYLRKCDAEEALRAATAAYNKARGDSKQTLDEANALVTRAERELKRQQNELAKFEKRTARELKRQQDELKRQQDELAEFANRTLGQRAFLDKRVAGLEKVVSRRKENLQGADDAVSAARAKGARCIARLKAIQADLQAAVLLHNEPQGAPATLKAAVVRNTEPQGAVRASAASRRSSRQTRAMMMY